jgi:hypothetical protein
MGRQAELLKNGKDIIQKALEMQANTQMTIKQIAQELNVDYQRLQRILKRTKPKKNELIIPQIDIEHRTYEPSRIEIVTSTTIPDTLEQNLQLQNLSLRKSIDATQMLITKIEELEKYIGQLKMPDGTINTHYSREFLVAWKQMIDTLEWVTDRRIKLQESLENQIFRESIIECIKQSEPKIAILIKEIIDRKREENGLI